MLLSKIKFPTAQTILFMIAAMVTLLTWIVPAGNYETLSYQKEENTFLKKSSEKSTTLPASQKTLEDLHIKIPLEKFTSGAIWKPINIPNTYSKSNPKPQGITDFFKAPIKGIIAASDIIFLVLIIGGLIGVMNKTQAFDAGISKLSKILLGKEYLLIILVTTLVALGGTTFGLAEETIAFYPILIPVFLAAKYDVIVALACIYIGSSIGTMCSTVNPFSVIIASDAAGIQWTEGLKTRILFLILGTLICLFYILRYAKKVKNNPSNSIVFDQKAQIEKQFHTNTDSIIPLTSNLKIILFIFMLSFIVMIYGVAKLNWWFMEMTTVFLVASILIGFIGKIKEQIFVDTFVKGASELLGVALIIGIARGISIIMEDGSISDTLLYYASTFTDGMSKGIFVNALFVIYGALSFFIPSSSGMAVLTMPIMAPLADTVNISREIIVNIYQFGMGLFAFVNPTGLILASLAIANIGYNKWLKFILPLVLILFVVFSATLTILVYL